MIVSQESELIDSTPPAGGTGFIDLRKAPVPPEPLAIEDQEPEVRDQEGAPTEYEPTEPADDVPDGGEVLGEPMTGPGQPAADDLSSSSTSMARMQLESDRMQRRSLQSSEFFRKREWERQSQREQKRKEGIFF